MALWVARVKVEKGMALGEAIASMGLGEDLSARVLANLAEGSEGERHER